MAIETIGKYQLHLIALEASQEGGWDPYVSVFKFDDDEQDFKCLLEKHPASASPLASYEAAIEQARRTGNTLIASGRFDQWQADVRNDQTSLPPGFTPRPGP